MVWPELANVDTENMVAATRSHREAAVQQIFRGQRISTGKGSASRVGIVVRIVLAMKVVAGMKLPHVREHLCRHARLRRGWIQCHRN